MKLQVRKLKTDSQFKCRSQSKRFKTLEIQKSGGFNTFLWALDNSDVDYAYDFIIGCIELLKHRNKLIRIADTSYGGSDNTRQYKSKPIASDSDDESKIGLITNLC